MKTLLILTALGGFLGWQESRLLVKRGDHWLMACAGRDNLEAVGFEAYVRNFMSSSRGAAARERRGLEAMPADSVNLVADPVVCARADSAVASIDTVPRAGERVLYVVRAGAEYWVEDPRVLAGEYTNGFVFDTAFTRLIRRNFR